MDRAFKKRMIESTLIGLWWLIFGSAAVWLLVGSAGYWIRLGWLPAEAAGWVQALGVIVSIAVAISIPAFQARRQAQARIIDVMEAKLAGCAAIRALVNYQVDLNERIVNEPRANALLPSSSGLPGELRQCASMLREVPITTFSNDLVHMVLGIRDMAAKGEFAATVLEGRALDFRRSLITVKAKENIELLNTWLVLLDAYEVALQKHLP